MFSKISRGRERLVVGGLLSCVMAASPVNAGELVFGFSPDAAPVSSPEMLRGAWTGKVLGFCGELASFLEKENYQLIPRALAAHKRFDVFATTLETKPGIQCGANSRTREREKALAVGVGHGAFSHPFLVTSTKLLIRREKIASLYDSPEALRVGILASPDGSYPVTTSLITDVFPTIQVAPVSSRAEADLRLSMPVNQAEAIDAYASDEVILVDMLAHDLAPELRQNYAIEPPLYGFSREEYVLAIYNAPELVNKINAWLDSAQGRSAAAKLEPAQGLFTRVLRWAARGDHLPMARMVLLPFLIVGLLLAGVGLWGYRQAARKGHVEKQPPTRDDMRKPETDSSATEREEVGMPDTARPTPLTPRETEVLALMVKGNSSKEIARELGGLSPRTIETHRKNIYAKLGVSTPYELVDYARRTGLV